MEIENKKTLIIGASEKQDRYSYLAINRLLKYGHDVVAIGQKPGTAFGINFEIGKPALDNIDTVSLYINPKHQKEYYDYILSLHPKRIIFNPGTENDELFALAKANNIKPQDACTLVMLASGLY
jgi:uncharacterized protein